PQDVIRACALYSEVAIPAKPYVAPNEPLTVRNLPLVHLQEAAQEKIAHCQSSLAPDDFLASVYLGAIGLNNHFEPVTFWLEPGFWVHLDLRGATVTANGQDTRVELGIGTGGIVYLPVQHTDISVGDPPVLRHFVEISAWTPNAPDWQTWTLTWHLFEVVRDD